MSSAHIFGHWLAEPWTSHAAVTVTTLDHNSITNKRVVAECEFIDEARLIAAAPDLLTELQNIANARTAKWADPSEFEAWAKNRARYAIAKAQGGIVRKGFDTLVLMALRRLAL